jgi:RHS repeat-associated protein
VSLLQASSIRRTRLAPGCYWGSESRRGLQPTRRARRRGSECRKSLHTPGLCCIGGQGRGRQNIFEQINSEEHATYLHHDQQGSTRLLTSEKGEVTGAYSYGAYGATEGHTGTATTPLGYDGQYTSPDTGLIYLRARTYDPSTAQFLSVDPAVEVTHQPYIYAEDNPLNNSDPTGMCNANPFSESFWTKGNCISENTGQAGEAVAIGVCVIATSGYCLGAAAAAYGYNTILNATQPCGFSVGEPALLTATAGLSAAPGLGLEIPQLLGLADEAPAGVNALLAGPGAVITALEKDIKRELLGEQ